MIEDTSQSEDEIFYIWECNLPLYNIYKIAYNYLTEYYGLPENILLKLIEEFGLTYSESLAMIPYIHSGYLSVISPAVESNG